MRINCDILDLRVFLAVVDLRGFRVAADALNISQPALSRRLKALETTLGVVLLERSTRHVTPTRTGLELYTHARRIVDDFDACFSSFYEGRTVAGLLSIAALPTITIHFLPPLLRRFAHDHPAVRVQLLDVTSSEVMDAVLRGYVDFGLMQTLQPHHDLALTPIMRDELALACRYDHELAGCDFLEWKEIAHRDLIGSQQSENRANRELHRVGLNLNWKYKVVHLSTSLRLVEAGLGVAVLPKISTPETEHPVKVLPLRNPSVSRTINIVQRRSGRLSPAAEAFRSLVVAQTGEPEPATLPKEAEVDSD